MSLTHSQYRVAIWVFLGIAGGVFTLFEFLSNLKLHLNHDQSMPAALGLASIGTIPYAFMVAALVAVIGVLMVKFVRAVLTPDTKGNNHE